MQEKKKLEKQQTEYYQTQWRKHVDKLTIPPKQTPVYLAVSKGQNKEKKHKTGKDLHYLMQNMYMNKLYSHKKEKDIYCMILFLFFT